MKILFLFQIQAKLIYFIYPLNFTRPLSEISG